MGRYSLRRINALDDNPPGGRKVLTEEEMKELWERIDKKKLDKGKKT